MSGWTVSSHREIASLWSTRLGLLTPRQRSCPIATTHYLAEANDILAIAQYAYQHGGIALIDHLNAFLLVGNEDDFKGDVAGEMTGGKRSHIAGRSATLLGALARLHSEAIDVVLL